ncbi:MAG: cation diffusion facilitator family transporter [Sphingomonadales bacterium]
MHEANYLLNKAGGAASASTGHGHHHHANERAVLLAALLTGGFMFVEIAGGLITGSLALLADAAHMASDAAALGMAYLAFRFSHRPADTRRTFGFHRLQVLAAFTNGLLLIGAGIWIMAEAVERMMAPATVLATPMLMVAVLGLIVNLAAFFILHRADRANLNIRGALYHVVGDLLGSVAAIAAAMVIHFTGWMPIDPILSMLVTLLVLRAAWRLIRDAGHILLEGTPPHLDLETVRTDLVASIPAITDVHHIHAWALTEERPLMTLHATLAKDADMNDALLALKHRLFERFGIAHSTIELEQDGCDCTCN